MKDPLQFLLQPNNSSNSYFAPTSRYYGLEISIHTEENGDKKPYIKRRFIAQSDAFQVISEHKVQEGDRLDNISYKHLGDPELFWRICDANVALHPLELTDEIGKYIKITLPEGFKL
ncbi:MAG: hypothetical protein KA536_15925 [Saprospiraceae bacterium]|nr:hypothetical protein [Saprospiraceae bacterium]